MLLPCEPGDGGRLTPGPKPPGPEGPKSPTTSPPADPPRAAWRMAPDTDVSGTDTRPCPGGRGGGGRLGGSNASLGGSGRGGAGLGSAGRGACGRVTEGSPMGIWMRGRGFSSVALNSLLILPLVGAFWVNSVSGSMSGVI